MHLQDSNFIMHGFQIYMFEISSYIWREKNILNTCEILILLQAAY